MKTVANATADDSNNKNNSNDNHTTNKSESKTKENSNNKPIANTIADNDNIAKIGPTTTTLTTNEQRRQ